MVPCDVCVGFKEGDQKVGRRLFLRNHLQADVFVQKRTAGAVPCCAAGAQVVFSLAVTTIIIIIITQSVITPTCTRGPNTLWLWELGETTLVLRK